MTKYLYQASYSGVSWATQVERQGDVKARISPLAEKLGGTVDAAYYTFGEYDVVAILEFPNDTAMAAFAIAIQAGGSTRSGKTTTLMSASDGADAIRRAAEARGSYVPPVSGEQ